MEEKNTSKLVLELIADRLSGNGMLTQAPATVIS